MTACFFDSTLTACFFDSAASGEGAASMVLKSASNVSSVFLCSIWTTFLASSTTMAPESPFREEVRMSKPPPPLRWLIVLCVLSNTSYLCLHAPTAQNASHPPSADHACSNPSPPATH